jgi:hypothetical protein
MRRSSRPQRTSSAEPNARVLVVHPSVEDQRVPKVPLEAFSLHSRAAPLDGIQDVDPGIDHVGNDLPDRPIVVMEGEGSRLVSQIDHPLHSGDQELPNVLR